MTGDLAALGAPPAPGFGLAPLTEADAAELFAHFADPRVVEWLDIAPMTGLEEARATIRWAERRLAAGEGVRWAIRDLTGAFVGTCGFNTLELRRGRRGEVAYDLSWRWWRKGVMAAVLPALITFGFERLALRRLEAFVTPGNIRSSALLARHGFVREGILRDYGFWKGRFFDQILFGLTSARPDPTL